jgi:hypothetical protein
MTTIQHWISRRAELGGLDAPPPGLQPRHRPGRAPTCLLAETADVEAPSTPPGTRSPGWSQTSVSARTKIMFGLPRCC